MLPFLFACKCGNTKLDRAQGALTLISIILSKITGSISSIGLYTGFVAALFTKISMRPKAAIVLEINCFRWSSFPI